jgi:hypothetical protein
LFVFFQLYKEDPATGEIRLALSSDSTCTSHLKTSSDGYETLMLRPRPQPAWPVEVQISQDESGKQTLHYAAAQLFVPVSTCLEDKFGLFV